MAPKKGKKGKKGKGKDKKEEADDTQKDGSPEPTDKEALLQQEYVFVVHFLSC